MATKKPAKKTVKAQALSAAGSYLRASAAAAGALYLSGITDPKILANAFVAGLIGPVCKAVQPNEKEYGVGSGGGGKSHQVA